MKIENDLNDMNTNYENLEKEYENFVENHSKGHFAQSLRWAKTKEEWDHEIVMVRDDDGKIKGSMLLLIRKIPALHSALVYSPRGPVCNIEDKETFQKLTKQAEEVAKKYKAFMLRMDPDIANSDMQFRDIVKENGYKIVDKVKDLNDIIHPKIVFRLNLKEKTEDELFASFHQKTRYNIRLAGKKNVTVREGKREDIAEFQKIMEVTGSRDKFPIPDTKYFEELYDIMGEDHVKILFADYEGQAIATTYNFLYGNKVWYMFGGSLNEKRNLMPTYLLQWEGIKWAKENGCDIYDFRGICAVDLEHRNEGLYRFKKGFNPDLIEFMEIYKVYNPFVYFVFKKLFPFYRKIRVMLMKKRKEK